MTKSEFLVGWNLLVLQPWGWRYNQVGKDNRPTADALAQLDLYFDKLSWAHPQAWAKVATRYAEGKEWPSIQDLRQALQHVNGDFVKALPDRSREHASACPPEVRAILARIGVPVSAVKA